ncbi:MAG: DGQHR domain-containing protein [Thermoflavifilum sp.]|nr:DGQHR domain-containing protein [Thermoflavifilum sp.]
MLATQICQKGNAFYFVAYPAEDLLRRIKFVSRFYQESRDLAPRQEIAPADEVGQFIAKIERTDDAFQREVSRRKILDIENFYETAENQPPIPGTVLLFSREKLQFEPISGFEHMGNLHEPQEHFLIIDGQHRLAALHFYLQKHPEEARMDVPCIIFDGNTQDFAIEMFVVINSTPTRINKSHLVDLYEKIAWTTPDKQMAAIISKWLYERDDSPLQYKINRLGSKSRQKKWILQAELFNELFRWTKGWEGTKSEMRKEAEWRYAVLRDFLKAASVVWGDIWGHERYMVTKPVTLKAMIRVAIELARNGQAEPEEGRVERWISLLQPWTKEKSRFQMTGFYERFAARGQVERTQRIFSELWRLLAVES